MSQLVKVTSNIFDSVHVDFFTNETGDVIMTAEQIGSALGYANPRQSIINIYNRNKPRIEKYSVETKLISTDGKEYETRIFNEHGIYAMIFLSNKPKAIEFQEWVYERISEIRKNNFSMVTTSQPHPELIEKVRELESKIDSFITITSYEARMIQKGLAKRVYEVIQDASMRPLGFQELHREIRDRFGVPSYREIPRGEYINVMNYIKGWIPKKVTA